MVSKFGLNRLYAVRQIALSEHTNKTFTRAYLRGQYNCVLNTRILSFIESHFGHNENENDGQSVSC